MNSVTPDSGVHQASCHTVFAVPGVHNDHLFDALYRASDRMLVVGSGAQDASAEVLALAERLGSDQTPQGARLETTARSRPALSQSLGTDAVTSIA